jgi:hypothetical protein
MVVADPRPVLRFSARQVTALLAAGHGSLSATESWDETRGDLKLHGTSTLTIGFRDDTVLDLAPVEPRAYDHWLPRPYVDSASDAQVMGVAPKDRSVALALQLRFLKPDGTPSPTRSVLHLNLREVSKNRGLCSNYPPKEKAQVTSGLIILPDQDGWTVDSDGQHAHTTHPENSIRVLVAAVETGAHGKVTAEAETPQLHARYRTAGLDYVNLPDDRNDNDIADAWERDKGIFGENRPANWDAEDTPQGPDTGDGLTLYEEYRGVVFTPDGNTERFQRLSPEGKKKKEFCFVDRAQLVNPTPVNLMQAIVDGLALRERAAGDRVLVLAEAGEVWKDGKLHQVNFNSSSDPSHFGKPHHAVHIYSDSLGPPGAFPGPHRPYGSTYDTLLDTGDPETRSVPRSADSATMILHPGNAWGYIADMQLMFQTGAIGPHDGRWLQEHHLTGRDMAERLKRPDVHLQLATRRMVYTVAHEAGHAVGRYHHESDVPTPGREGPLLWEKADDPPNTCLMHYPSGPPDREFLGGYWDPSANALEGPANVDDSHPGWIGQYHTVPYAFCPWRPSTLGNDNGIRQGGHEGPRYKTPE